MIFEMNYFYLQETILISGAPQGSVVGLLLFLIYINDIPDGITSLYQVFAEDASSFSKAQNIYNSVNKLNAEVEKGSQWVIHFNYDPNKKANEVIFSRKSDSANVLHPSIKINNNSIAKCPNQKQLGNALIGITRRPSVNLPRNT